MHTETTFNLLSSLIHCCDNFGLQNDCMDMKTTHIQNVYAILNCTAWKQSVFTARDYAKRGICRRRVSVCVCVCLSVYLSVTLRYCIKTTKRRITQTTPHDSPMTLVFWYQISWRNSNRIIPYRGDKCRWGGLKLVTFDEKRAITRKRYKIDA